VTVDEREDHRNARSSSAWAKYADALHKISFARRSSQLSCPSRRIRSASSDDNPGLTPSSISAHLTQLRSDSVPIPSCFATRPIVL
jgi:hypothetical protein